LIIQVTAANINMALNALQTAKVKCNCITIYIVS